MRFYDIVLGEERHEMMAKFKKTGSTYYCMYQKECTQTYRSYYQLINHIAKSHMGMSKYVDVDPRTLTAKFQKKKIDKCACGLVIEDYSNFTRHIIECIVKNPKNYKLIMKLAGGVYPYPPPE